MAIVLSVFTVGFFSPLVMADISDTKIDAVKANCDVARSTLQRVVSGDKTMRINRGRAYDRMGKLFNNFSERLDQNGISNTKFQELSNKFDDQVAKFRSNYDTYRSVIDDVIKQECVNRPAEFYSGLENARSKRSQLNENIKAINQTITEYGSAVNNLAQGIGAGDE